MTAQKNQWELDKLQTQSEMLKKFTVDEVDSHSKEGAYIIGLSMQGARWDPNAVSIEKSKARLAPCMRRRRAAVSCLSVIVYKGFEHARRPCGGHWYHIHLWYYKKE